MNTKQTYWLIGIITVASFLIGFYFYPQFPENIASHWGANGEVNGYMPKFWGLFLMPIIMIFISSLLILLPKIDPLKANIALFQKSYNSIIAGVTIFLFYIPLLTVFWNLGFTFNMTVMIVPPMALLWLLLGIAMPKMKQNWFMGFRTPWTLASVRVWDETHKIGGKLFVYSGILAVIGLLLPQYTIWFVIVPIIFSSIFTTIYSYFLFKKFGTDVK